MQSTILVLIMFLSIAVAAFSEWWSPGKATIYKTLLVVVALLALVGLLGHWGLPIATDIVRGLVGT